VGERGCGEELIKRTRKNFKKPRENYVGNKKKVPCEPKNVIAAAC